MYEDIQATFLQILQVSIQNRSLSILVKKGNKPVTIVQSTVSISPSTSSKKFPGYTGHVPKDEETLKFELFDHLLMHSIGEPWKKRLLQSTEQPINQNLQSRLSNLFQTLFLDTQDTFGKKELKELQATGNTQRGVFWKRKSPLLCKDSLFGKYLMNTNVHSLKLQVQKACRFYVQYLQYSRKYFCSFVFLQWLGKLGNCLFEFACFAFWCLIFLHCPE